MKRRIIIAVVLLALLAVATWLITQPRKSLQVNVRWTPPYPEFMQHDKEYNPMINGKEHIIYQIYYAWNNKPQRLPWWIVTDSLDGQWRVIESANSDNYSSKPEDNAIFNDQWIEDGRFNRVARTRVQIFQHVCFSSENDFSEEKESLQIVASLIKTQHKLEKQGCDLFDGMAAYMKSHPEYGIFQPSSKSSYDAKFQAFHDEYLKRNSDQLEPSRSLK